MFFQKKTCYQNKLSIFVFEKKNQNVIASRSSFFTSTTEYSFLTNLNIVLLNTCWICKKKKKMFSFFLGKKFVRLIVRPFRILVPILVLCCEIKPTYLKPSLLSIMYNMHRIDKELTALAHYRFRWCLCLYFIFWKMTRELKISNQMKIFVGRAGVNIEPRILNISLANRWIISDNSIVILNFIIILFLINIFVNTIENQMRFQNYLAFSNKNVRCKILKFLIKCRNTLLHKML